MINIDLIEADLVLGTRRTGDVHVAFESTTSLADRASLVNVVHWRFTQVRRIEVLFRRVELSHESTFGHCQGIADLMTTNAWQFTCGLELCLDWACIGRNSEVRFWTGASPRHLVGNDASEIVPLLFSGFVYFDLSSLLQNSIEGVNQPSLVMLVPKINHIFIHSMFLKEWALPIKLRICMKMKTFADKTYFFSHSSMLTPKSSMAFFILGESKSKFTLSSYLRDRISLMLLLYLICGTSGFGGSGTGDWFSVLRPRPSIRLLLIFTLKSFI